MATSQSIDTKEPFWMTLLPTLNQSDFSLKLALHLFLKVLLNMEKKP